MSFFHDLVRIEPAWREDDYLGSVLNNFVPLYSVRWLAKTAESFYSSSVIDHLGNPVSASPRRLEPFHEEDPWPGLYRLRFLPNPVYSLQHLRIQLLQKLLIDLVNIASTLLNLPINIKAPVELLVDR